MALISDNIRELRVGMQYYETLILTAGFIYKELRGGMALLSPMCVFAAHT